MPRIFTLLNAVTAIAIFNMVTNIQEERQKVFGLSSSFKTDTGYCSANNTVDCVFEYSWLNFDFNNWKLQVTLTIIQDYLFGVYICWMLMEMVLLHFFGRMSLMMLRHIHWTLYVWLLLYYSHSFFLAIRLLQKLIITSNSGPEVWVEYRNICRLQLLYVIGIFVEVSIVHWHYVIRGAR